MKVVLVLVVALVSGLTASSIIPPAGTKEVQDDRNSNFVVDPQATQDGPVDEPLPAINPYISGGQDALEIRWPWIVSVRNGATPKNRLSTGTLIHSRWVITGAQHVATPDDLSVYVGSLDMRIPGKMYKVIRVIRNPDYSINYIRGGNIALLELADDVLFDAMFVRPIILPNKLEDFAGVRNCWIAAWSRFDEEFDVNILQEARVGVYDNEHCVLSSSTGLEIKANHICAGGKGINSGTTDQAGSPLICEVYGVWKFVGSQNGFPITRDYPITFERVSYYLDWIRQETGL